VNAVAGWTPTSAAATGAPTAVTAPNCGTAALCDVAPFYFIAPGAYTFNFSYVRASDGQGSPEVPVTINVTGPTATGAGGAFLTATVQNPPARYDGVHSTTPLQIVNVWPGSPPYLRFGQNGDNPGIVFYVAAQPPAAAQAQAQFQFVQVITASKFSWLTSAAMNGGSPNVSGGLGPGRSAVLPPSLAVDQYYPYPATYTNPNQALDYPGMGLSVTSGAPAYTPYPVGEGVVVFAATIYLMWDPALPGPGQAGGCHAASNNPVAGSPIAPTASNCTGSIPVPLGYLAWGFSGDAINSLNPGAPVGAPADSNGTGWVLLNCGGPNPAAPSAQPNSAYLVGSYPQWNMAASNN
jgi:hypothetical protein